MPFAATTSSVRPSAETAAERIVWLIVSPVARAAVMMAVPSISPTTIRALRARRRRTLRTPRRKKTRLRIARAASPATTIARMRTGAAARPPTGMPNSLLMPTSSGCRERRRVGDRDFVGLAAGRRAQQRHELVDLGRVQTARHAPVGGLVVGPEGHDERFAFGGGEDVAPLVAGLVPQVGHHGLFEELDRARHAHPYGVDLCQCHPGDHHLAPP